MHSEAHTIHADTADAKSQTAKPAIRDMPARTQIDESLTLQRAGIEPSSLSAREVLQLQRTIGNQAVGRLLTQPSSAKEALAGENEPDQTREMETARITSMQVSAVFPAGSNTPVQSMGRFTPKPDAIVAEQAVGPTGAPTVHAGGGNDCTPGTEALDWNVVDAGANWRANVVALNVSGDIHITAWPSAPSSMTVPNTPNPVDGGNINNTAGSTNHWQTAINDMADYDNAGGGAGPNWHSTAASTAHEWAHWNEDYLRDCIPSSNWTQANTDIDAITVPKAGNPDATAARAALTSPVTTRFNQFVRAATARWNVIIRTTDNPGAGGRGYAAGMRVLNGHITAVRSYARTKGW